MVIPYQRNFLTNQLAREVGGGSRVLPLSAIGMGGQYQPNCPKGSWEVLPSSCYYGHQAARAATGLLM
ncbi:hypothetical protein PanWU01x14_290970 [Parasponia andersonii]|uniref:Uncharacterized protein n=1 Tax=Parasponia andersonii TaxID=3476 RepID=A0A2P5AXL5_PARAD|nr:hypothetical protein PanWU01x14_290970 [Parasponia andersonii]